MTLIDAFGIDAFGSDVSISDANGLQHWNQMLVAFLAHSAKTPDHLAAVFETCPDFSLAYTFQGISYLSLGRRELVANAQSAYENAQAAVRRTGCNAREALYLKALGEWLAGYPRASADIMDAILAAHPQDAMAVKLGHGIRFILGDAAGMRTSVEAVLSTYDDNHPATGYVLGCHAFSAEETGSFALAEKQGRRGLELAADDAWGLHAVAHVYDMTAQAAVGEEWLSRRSPQWAHCNNFGYHVWWHLALFQLAQGQSDKVLDLYDTKFRAVLTDDYRDISNATSMLVRLELEGVSVGNRWDELADLSENRVQDGCVVFADLHYMLALARTGRRPATSTLIQTLETEAGASTRDMALVAKAAGVSAAHGLRAYYDADFAGAYQNLMRARAAMQSVGGSHAQRDVFERIIIDTAIRANLFAEAKYLLSDRAHRRGAIDRFGADRSEILKRAGTGSTDTAPEKIVALPA